MGNLLMRRRLSNKIEYLEEYDAEWLVPANTANPWFFFKFSDTATDPNYPANFVNDLPDTLYFISKTDVRKLIQNYNVGASPINQCRFAGRDSSWQYYYFPVSCTSLDDFLVVNGFYYQWYKITKENFLTAYNNFTASGRTPMNSTARAGIKMYENTGTTVKDKWVIAYDGEITPQVIKRLKPHN